MEKWKRKLSKILAIALTASLLLQSGVSVYAAADQKQQGSREILETIGIPVDQEEVQGTEELLDDTNEGISLFSLLPIEERNAYLPLNGYTDEELANMPLETVLSLLRDSDGDAIEIPADAEVVWTYFKDDNGTVIKDEYHEIGRDETVDLSQRYSMAYKMELIIGTANQLDASNVCYNVTVYISDIIESIEYNLYEQIGSYSRKQITADKVASRNIVLQENTEIPVTEIFFAASSHIDGNIYYLGIESTVASNRKDITVDVYPMTKFLDYYQNGNPLSGSITDQILNQDRMYMEGGYQSTFTEPVSSADNNVFCVVYADTKTGDIIAYQGVAFTVCSEVFNVSGSIYSYESGIMKDITNNENCTNYSYGSWTIQFKPGTNGVIAKPVAYAYRYDLTEGYSANKEYYYVLEANEHINKVVLGRYNTLDEAEKAKDITEQILPADKSKEPYGYPFNYQHGIPWFTVFFDNGMTLVYYVALHETATVVPVPSEGVKYDNAPARGSDPYFRIQGADGYNDVYIVENNNVTTLDTLYRYGYQTVLINDISADLQNLKPKFYVPENVKASVGEEQISGVSEQDFSNGSVYYAVHIDDNLKNYNVTFVKKESGAKLFVNGPDKREIFLDDYFENRHDILIANVGDAELTGLQVELIDPVHVKLDDYWTVGGTGNDTLAAFTNDYYSSYSDKKQANLAKIRLLPDGDGEVSGTLKISADGQEPVYIELTGYAGNPKIITESLDEAVKYVPYSYVVATDNMHDWNTVTFNIAKGKLPEGLDINSATGEIYGAALESGEFPVTVRAAYSRNEFENSYADFVLTVKENSNENVYMSSDSGYELQTHIGTETTGAYDYLLEDFSDQLFVSSGKYGEFIDFWLNGERLDEGIDYEKESGSTKVTVKSQTFRDKAQNGINTIAAEFRVDADENKELKRTAQNFRIYFGESDDDNNSDDNNSSNSNSSSNDSNDSNESSNSNNNTENINNNANQESTRSENNSTVSADDSWIKNDNGWWYMLPDGSWPADTWLQIQYNGISEWFYFDDRGYMATGWLLYKGQWYYLNPVSDGTQGVMCTSWKFIDGKWYYFNEEGILATNTWIQLPYEGTIDWYYFDEQGVMKTGWFLHNNQWYYLNPVSDGTQGMMYAGWKFIDGKWYYFNEISDGTKGALQTSTWIGDYYVDENGVWIE